MSKTQHDLRETAREAWYGCSNIAQERQDQYLQEMTERAQRDFIFLMRVRFGITLEYPVTLPIEIEGFRFDYGASDVVVEVTYACPQCGESVTRWELANCLADLGGIVTGEGDYDRACVKCR